MANTIKSNNMIAQLTSHWVIVWSIDWLILDFNLSSPTWNFPQVITTIAVLFTHAGTEHKPWCPCGLCLSCQHPVEWTRQSWELFLCSRWPYCSPSPSLFLAAAPGKAPGRSCSIVWEGAEEEMLEWRLSTWHCVSVFSQGGNPAPYWGHTLFPETFRNLGCGMNLFIFPLFKNFIVTQWLELCGWARNIWWLLIENPLVFVPLTYGTPRASFWPTTCHFRRQKCSGWGRMKEINIIWHEEETTGVIQHLYLKHMKTPLWDEGQLVFSLFTKGRTKGNGLRWQHEEFRLDMGNDSLTLSYDSLG